MSGSGKSIALEMREELLTLHERATFLAAVLAATDDEWAQSAVERLRASVIRPLSVALRPSDVSVAAGAAAADPSTTEPGDALWKLASAATRLRASHEVPTEVAEAAAALQHLVCSPAPGTDPTLTEVRLAELRELQ